MHKFDIIKALSNLLRCVCVCVSWWVGSGCNTLDSGPAFPGEHALDTDGLLLVEHEDDDLRALGLLVLLQQLVQPSIPRVRVHHCVRNTTRHAHG